MLRSSVGLGVAGLIFLGSVLIAYSMGASMHADPHAASASGLVLTNSEVRFEPEPVEDLERTTEAVSPGEGNGAARGGALNSFTYQGVLTDLSGVPAVGPLPLEFLLYGDPVGGGARVVISGSFINDIMPDAAGRFQANVGLPFGSSIKDFKNFGLQINDGTDFTPIGDEIVVNPTPYAWLSEFSRSAETLIDDQSHTLGLPADFNSGPLGGGVPTATRVGSMVFLSGEMVNNFPNPNGALVGTLPVGMRPASSQVMTIHVSLSTMSGNAALRVTTNGEIRIISSNYGPGFVFFLNGACFPVE